MRMYEDSMEWPCDLQAVFGFVLLATGLRPRVWTRMGATFGPVTCGFWPILAHFGPLGPVTTLVISALVYLASSKLASVIQLHRECLSQC